MAEFDDRVDGFVKAAQAKVDAYFDQHYPGSTTKPTIVIEHGKRYIKVAKAEPNGGKSLYCFIDKGGVGGKPGNILTGSWKSAELRNPRSNIFEEDFGASGVTQYGTVYLR